MPELEFNGERIEAKPGETLLQAARRHGSHVWFMCDGRGICQTCECRVLSGLENLTGLSELERVSLGEERQGKGGRLACQASLAGSGPVSVVSRVEELRRRARDVLAGSTEQSRWESVQGLSSDSIRAGIDLVAGIVVASPHAIPQLLKHPPTPGRVLDYALDTLRLAVRLWRREIEPPAVNTDSNA